MILNDDNGDNIGHLFLTKDHYGNFYTAEKVVASPQGGFRVKVSGQLIN